jgi:hypothetical protein
MPDSNHSNQLADKHRQNRSERLVGIKRWVEYIREQPPEVWGAQQNRLVDSQLESARQTALSAEHEQRVRSFATSARAESKSESESEAGTSSDSSDSR